MKVGVLALQGAFREHMQMLERLGVAAREVRLPAHLAESDALIIPGGESTTIGKIARAYGLLDAIREMALAGAPVWGTCAGMILLAKDIGPEPAHVAVMDITVERNAFGRQAESFETDLLVPAVNGGGEQFHAVFIRAPLIAAAGPDVRVLARLDDGRMVAARQGNLLATSFHPELTGDTRFHRYFIEHVRA